MSAHALACRKTDLTDFLAVLLGVLEPLFAFLLVERRAGRAVTGIPVTGIADSKSPGRDRVCLDESRPATIPDTGIPASAGEAALPALDMGNPIPKDRPAGEPADADRNPLPAQTFTEGGPVTPYPPPATDADLPPADDSPPASDSADALFVKVAGRFRPAPPDAAGPTFRRLVSAGGRTRYVAA